MLITIQQKRSALTISALIFQIRGRPIEQVDHAKLLGVMIECSMSWEHQIDTICRIISSRLSLLRRIKPYSALILLYNSIILVSPSLRHHRLQNRAARILLDANFSSASLRPPQSRSHQACATFLLLRMRVVLTN